MQYQFFLAIGVVYSNKLSLSTWSQNLNNRQTHKRFCLYSCIDVCFQLSQDCRTAIKRITCRSHHPLFGDHSKGWSHFLISILHTRFFASHCRIFFTNVAYSARIAYSKLTASFWYFALFCFFKFIFPLPFITFLPQKQQLHYFPR